MTAVATFGRYMLPVIFSGISFIAGAQYRLALQPADPDSNRVEKAGIQVGGSSNSDPDNNKVEKAGLTTVFRNRYACEEYVNRLPAILRGKGFPVASVDQVQYSTDSAAAIIFFGPRYRMGSIQTDSIDPKLLTRAGWDEPSLANKPLDLARLEELQRKVFSYLENNGYPFARVQLDSLRFEEEKLYARLVVDKGPYYTIDSIRIYGEAAISNNFMQHYLGITNGSMYQRSKLQNITARIRELPYVTEMQPWDLTLLGTGSVVNLYLKPRKSSQINALIGFLPAGGETGTGKLQVTGEATINLRNALGNGERIAVNWQQLQVKSPRLDLAFDQPYLFGTPVGITSSFNLFKKDSSFINLGLLLGIQYTLSDQETGKFFIQRLGTNLLEVDTLFVKNNRQLPDERDISSVNLGVDYAFNKTDYRFNPRKGTAFQVIATAGTRKLRKNNVILKLSSPDFSYEDLYDKEKLSTYQFRVKLSGAHYIPLGRHSTLKTALDAGWFQSPEIYRNELFQIGGYKLLRGFDEESIYASRYSVAEVEYRYLMGLNSYLFGFADFGYAANTSLQQQVKNNFIGAGLGLAFETRAGLFNISYAAGKRNDLRFDIRQSKIHLGYINYF